MSEFEQMMAEIDVPEEIAQQLSDAATNGEILAVWKKLAPAVDKCMIDASTAAGVCAMGMMVAYVGDQLSQNVKFGKSPEDVGENVHPNFCIMAIALIAVNTLKASRAALELAKKEDGDGNEETSKKEGQEKGSKKEGQKKGADGDQAGGNSEQAGSDS